MRAALELSDMPRARQMSGFDCASCPANVQAERRCSKPCRMPRMRDNIAARLDPERERCYRLDLEDMDEASQWLARYPDYKRRGLTWEEEERYPLRELAAMRVIDNTISGYERERYQSMRDDKPGANRANKAAGQKGYPTVQPPWGYKGTP